MILESLISKPLKGYKKSEIIKIEQYEHKVLAYIHFFGHVLPSFVVAVII